MCSLSHSNSLTRVRSIQRLVEQLELDGLLCIPGVDSNYNEGCWRLYCYLLCDLSGDELEQLELGPTTEEEDTFLLITANRICVYCHPSCYSSLATRLGKWHPELCLFCDLSHPDPEDTDHFEVYKVEAFIQITEGLERIGVPFGKGSVLSSRDFSEMSVEQWPLIQAYALEEMGGLGFFTRTHRVCDVSSALDLLLSEVDPLSVSYLQRRGARLFSKQWDDLVDGVSCLAPEGIWGLSEQGLLGGIKTYLQHAKLSRQSGSRAKGYAYLLIGPNSQKLKYKPCPVASNLATVGTSDGMSHQCVVELSDPLLPLTAARTFFFTQDYSPYHSDTSTHQTRNTDHGYLLELYKQLVGEIRSAIETLSGVSSLGELRESVGDRLREVVNRQVSGGDIGIDVSVSAYNLLKAELLDTSVNHKNVYYLKATLTDILSPDNPSRKLGAIVFGESFILSRLQIESTAHEPPMSDSRCLILSNSVPLLVTWADRESQLLAGENLKACLLTEPSQLGNLISLGVNDISLSTEFVEGLVFSVKLHVLSKGLLLQNSIWKFVWLPWILIEKIQLFEGSNEDKSLQIFPNKEFDKHLPVFLQSHFSVHFSPTGTENHKLYRETVRCLKSVREGEDFFTSHQTAPSQPGTGPGAITDISQHIEISWLYDSTISPQTLSSLTLANLATNCTENRIPVHIVAGLPGSGADFLATFIIEKTLGSITWVLMHPPMGCDHLFDRKEFENLFQTRIQECLQKIESPETECRVMIVSPCFSAPTQVVTAVLNHPSPAVRERVWITGVTLCVGARSSFTKNDRLHPLIMHSIRPGVISSIILTGYAPEDQECCDTRQYTQLLSLCRNIPTGAGVIQTAHVGKLSAEDLTWILSDHLFHKLGAVRSWYNPSLYKQGISGPIVSIEHRSIKCRHHLSQESLTSALTQLPTNVQYARGIVHLCSDTPLYHHMEMAHSHVQFYPINGSENSHDTSTISFYGHQLVERELLSVVQSCLPADKQRLSAKLEQNLTKEELTEIETRCKGTPLPEGVFFNGHQYVGFDGDRWELHPCRQKIVSQFLSELNEKIDSHNTQIDILYRSIFSE